VVDALQNLLNEGRKEEGSPYIVGRKKEEVLILGEWRHATNGKASILCSY